MSERRTVSGFAWAAAVHVFNWVAMYGTADIALKVWASAVKFENDAFALHCGSIMIWTGFVGLLVKEIKSFAIGRSR